MAMSGSKLRIFGIWDFCSKSARVEANVENGIETFSSEPGTNYDLRQRYQAKSERSD